MTADHAEKGERRQLSTAFWWGMKERQGSVLKTKILPVPAKAGREGDTFWGHQIYFQAGKDIKRYT